MFEVAESPLSQAVFHFEAGLALLAGHDVGAIAPVAIGADIKTIRGVIDRLEAQCARRVEVFDREQAFRCTGDTSTTSWLRRTCNLSGFSADQRVKLARQLPELEATQTALEAGEIGIEHALEIARATDDLGAGAETELLSAAHQKDPAELRQAAKEIRHRVDAAGMARQALEQLRKRRLHLFNLPDGMVGLEGALPPEGGVALRLTLDALTGVPPKGDERTQQQRHADALMELCRRQLDSGTLPRVNGRKPHLTVVVQAETLAGEAGAPAAHLEGAGPISGETAKRLLCGGSASVLAVDKQGVALDLGRSRRLATEPQRRVLVAQNRYCIFQSCNWEARFCEPHHLDEWALGGGTSVKRMVPLCNQHHALVHEGGWKIVAQADGSLAAAPPGDHNRSG